MEHNKSTNGSTNRADKYTRDYRYQTHDESSNNEGLIGIAVGAAAVIGGVLIYKSLSRSRKNEVKDTLLDALPTGLVKVEKAITINASRHDLYQQWRKLENLPNIMSHLESVKVIDEKRSHWVAKAPLRSKVEWDAEIEDKPGEVLSWKSVQPADIENRGSVSFKEAPGGRGTEVLVQLAYKAPAGKLGQTVAKLTGEEPRMQLADDLHHLKQRIETGVTATTEGQSSGRKEGGKR